MLDQLTDRPMDGLTAIEAAFGVAYLATKKEEEEEEEEFMGLNVKVKVI